MADGSGGAVEQIVIVRRGGPEEPQAKGGAWKIAYADFVTAMMAFFLVMWLINAANEKTKAQVASYFNPVKLVDNTTSTKGLKTPGDRTVTANKDETLGEADKAPESSSGETSKTEKEQPKPESSPAGEHGLLEDQIFRDPYLMLSQLAGEAASGAPDGQSDKRFAIVEQREPGKSGGPAFRDPFDPLSWKAAPQTPVQQPEKPQTKTPPEQKGVLQQTVAAQKTDAQVPPQSSQDDSIQALAIRDALRSQLHGLSHDTGPDLDVKQTKEGVLISLTDNLRFDMFAVGSVQPSRETVILMEKVAAAVKSYSGRIVIRGHTDGRRYRSGDYDNWRLSTARAQMAYYMLTRAGVPEGAVERIEGYADRDLKNAVDPGSAENRRIEILLRAGPS